MPLYDYKCALCDHKSVEFMRMCSAGDAPKVDCKCCQYPMTRQVAMPHTPMQEYETPIEMFSIAMSSLEEVREFKRKCPDVDCNDDMAHPDFGLPIARSRHQKLQALKAAGYVETN